MKKVIYLILIILMMSLAGCREKSPKDIKVSTSIETLKTVAINLETDKVATQNYQGYIDIKSEMNKKYQNNLKKVTVKDIKFSSNDNGIAVMYKYNQPFDEQAVKAIYDETKKGYVYTTYEYRPNEFKVYGFENKDSNEYTTKMQYLVMQVSTDTEKSDLKRKVVFTMVYEFNDGKKIEKPVEVEILK